MPPKRASKHRSSKSTTPAVAVKQQRSEGQSASLPESTTPTPQFSPTVLGEIISTAILGALQSAGIGTLNISPAVGEQRLSNPSMPQPTVVEDAASREIAELTNAVAPGRLTFASEKPDDTFSSVTFDLAPSSPHAKIPTMIFELDSPTNVPFSPFPEGFVGDFIPVSSAGAAISNTPASSVGQSIPQANAALTERTVTQTMQPLAYPLGVTVRDEHRLLSRRPTPVRPDRLAFYLKGYNNVTLDYLIQGFLHGFSIRYFGSLLAIRSPNRKSAMDNPTSVNDKLSKQLAAGRIVGPFDSPPFESFRVSPLGIVPKKLPGEFRLIHHLSYPEGLSVNDGIPKELATVKYATIDDAVRLIKAIGKGYFLAKTDIKSAFCIIPVAPRDFPLLGME